MKSSRHSLATNSSSSPTYFPLPAMTTSFLSSESREENAARGIFGTAADLQRISAVHHQGLRRDHAGVGAQEHDRARDVGRHAMAAEQRALDRRGLAGGRPG